MNLNGDNFKITRAGFSLTCLTCLTARVKKFAVKKNGTGDKMASETSGGLYNSSPDDEEDYDDPSELSIDAFLDTISDTGGGVSSLLACADLSSLKPEGPREKADFWQKLCGTKSSTDLYITQNSSQLHAICTIAPKCVSTSTSQGRADVKVQSHVTRMQWILLIAMAGCSLLSQKEVILCI
jgi:hypothetical protein